MSEANPHVVLAPTLFQLTKGKGTQERKEKWKYRSIIGMLNYLVNSTHPELSYVVHQCARFCKDLKSIHEVAVKSII